MALVFIEIKRLNWYKNAYPTTQHKIFLLFGTKVCPKYNFGILKKHPGRTVWLTKLMKVECSQFTVHQILLTIFGRFFICIWDSNPLLTCFLLVYDVVDSILTYFSIIGSEQGWRIRPILWNLLWRHPLTSHSYVYLH